MLEEIIIAIQGYFMAHRFIAKHKLWKWIILPGIFYAILFIAGLYFFWQSSAHVMDYFFSKTGLKTWLQQEEGGWLRFMFFFGQLVLHLILLLLYFSWFKYLIVIIGSPVFEWLSQKTATIIDAKTVTDSKQFRKNIGRRVRVALRNLVWQTFFIVCVLFLSLIPVAGWAAPVLLVFMECYYFGFSMFDYANEKRELSFYESETFTTNHKGIAMGNGMVFYIMHVLPFVGWVLAPGYAVIAATLTLQQRVE